MQRPPDGPPAYYLVILLAGALIWALCMALSVGVALGASGASGPTKQEKQQITHDAIQYWRATDGPAAAKALRNAEVIWDVAGVCDLQAGCAYVGGCTTLPADYCKVWVYGDGIDIWGQDWLTGVLKHEMGHLLGYNHGDPTCTMNEAYC